MGGVEGVQWMGVECGGGWCDGGWSVWWLMLMARLKNKPAPFEAATIGAARCGITLSSCKRIIFCFLKTEVLSPYPRFSNAQRGLRFRLRGCFVGRGAVWCKEEGKATRWRGTDRGRIAMEWGGWMDVDPRKRVEAGLLPGWKRRAENKKPTLLGVDPSLVVIPVL